MTAAAAACLVLWAYAVPVDGPMQASLEIRVTLRPNTVVSVETRVAVDAAVPGGKEPWTTRWESRADARVVDGAGSWIELPEGWQWTSYVSELAPC